MSNLSTYYSFNSPDFNLNRQIVNWATGYPVYDASLNGNAYVSTFNYKTGNGSLEMPKNTLSTPLPTATPTIPSLGTGNNNIEFSVSNDKLLVVFCGFAGGSVYYKKRTTITSAWSASVAFGPTTGTSYYSMAMTPDKAYAVFVPNNGYIYFTKDPSFNSVANYNSFTKTLDNASRSYFGIAVSNDGSRIAVVDTTKVYYADWNGTNYNALTQTLETKSATAQYIGISISANKDRIVYGDTGSYWYLSYWNGTNYNIGSAINTSGVPRKSYFNSDATLLFLSFYTSNIQYLKFNNNTNLYDNSGIIQMGNYDCHGMQCVDASANFVTLYSLAYSSGSINYKDLSYNTTIMNYCTIKSPIIDTGGLTIAYWLRSNHNVSTTKVFDFANTSNSNNMRTVIFNNYLRYVVVIGSSTSYFVDLSKNMVNDNKWYHIAMTHDYNSTLRIYIDSSLIGTFSVSYPDVIDRQYCYLGKSNIAGDGQFFGNIDDFRVYNSVLTQADITALYNTDAKNNYTNSKTYLLYSTPVESTAQIIPTPTGNFGTNKTYYYWNDPYATTNAIINKSNPYNFSYTYYNTVGYPNVKVSIVINDSVTLKVNGSIKLFNSGNTFLNPPTVALTSGYNLFEFVTYNTGSSAYFAAYVVDALNSSNYIFSTDVSMSGWNVMITGFYSNGYPVSSLLVNDSTSTAYANANAITTATNYQTFDSDLSSNKACKEIRLSNMNLKSKNEDIGNIFFSYP